MKYYSLNTFFRRHFGCRVYKIPVHAGFTCPNRDGTISSKGCIFCWNPGFSPAVAGDAENLREQIKAGMKSGKKKDQKYLVYFQPFTNTYAPVEKLRRLYETALAEPGVIGLSIATRPDCVPDPILELLAGYAKEWHIWLELGLQSSHDRTLDSINRGHKRADFENAVSRAQNRGLFICAHVILGLPGESPADMLKTADFLSLQAIQGVKIHHLQIFRKTPLEGYFQKGMVIPLTATEYVPLVCDFLEHLRPDLVIHRLMADTREEDFLLAPHWTASKSEVINKINKEFERRGTKQGSFIASRGLSVGSFPSGSSEQKYRQGLHRESDLPDQE